MRQQRYHTSAVMLIEDPSDATPQRALGAIGGSEGLSSLLRSFSLGSFGSSKVDNEVLLAQSADAFSRAVHALDLNYDYRLISGLKRRTLWGDDLPVVLRSDSASLDTVPKPFKVMVRLHDGRADIKVSRGLLGRTISDSKDVTLPATVNSPAGMLTVAPGPAYRAASTAIVAINVSPTPYAVEAMQNSITVDVYDKISDAISLEVTEPCPERSRAVLSALMDAYNKKRLERKRETSDTELEFLNARIRTLYDELTAGEREVQKFKTRSKFVSIQDEAPILLETSIEGREELMKAQAEVLYCEQVLAALREKPDDMLPTFAIPGSETDASTIVTEFNTQLTALDELKRSAKPGNHALDVAQRRVNQMRDAVERTVQQSLTAARKVVKERKSTLGMMSSHLGRLPEYEREYVSLYRENLLQNQLYAFLLEKRENAMLSRASTLNLGHVIEPPFTAPKPVRTSGVFLCVLTLLGATGVVTALALFNVRRRKRICEAVDSSGIVAQERVMEVKSGEEDAAVRAVRNDVLCAGKVAPVLVMDYRSDVRNFASRLAEAMADVSVCHELHENPTNLIATHVTLKSKRATEDGCYDIFVTGPECPRSDCSIFAELTGATVVMIINAGEMLKKDLAHVARAFNPERFILIVIKKRANDD